MTLGLDLAPTSAKRTRESTSKVRTGCSTCKSRRVKCDEAKPICRRCAVGGRTCEYNNTSRATHSPRNKITVYVPPAQSQPVFFVNDRGLDYFHLNLAARLDGQFNTKFWSKLVLQLSHSEPSIRHAVAAVSVIYQDVELSLRHPAGYVNANPEAQQEWGTAVRSLSSRIQAHTNSNLVPLVCCLLFTCIGFLRGSVESALFHAESGFNILAALRRDSIASPKPKSSLSSNDLQAIEDHIVPMFSRLNVLCSLAGRITPSIYAFTAREDSPQEDLADSRGRLFEISDACIRFIRDAGPKAAMFQIDVDDLVEQAKLQTRLDAWREQLNELLERTQAAKRDSTKDDAPKLLLLHYKTIYIWLRACTTAGEMATDAYHADFEELVCYAEQITQPGTKVVTPQPLSFDMHILGPLYYAALKCRVPTIRRRALDMLQSAPRREGLWNAHHAYVTAKRIIELEERHLINGQELPDEDSRVHGLHLPDDESRVYNVGGVGLDSWKFEHNIVPSPACPGTLQAVFQTKPWGLLGEWQIIKEDIEL